MDGFDQLPDSLILLIFNSVSDVKTLIRCRAVSKRFNSLVPQADSLRLKVDCVISSESGDDSDSLLLVFLKSIIKSLHQLVSPSPLPAPKQSQNSPAQILRGFDRVRDLEIELPSGDLRLEKGALVKWRAEFGKSLKTCAILGFRAIRDSSAPPSTGDDSGDAAADFARGLKSRVVWTISALIAASARYYLLKEVVREQRGLERLVLRDREGEGTVVMDKAGIAELRAEAAHVSDEEEEEEEEEAEEEEEDGERSVVRNRTRVPRVRMRMRHAPRLELNGGVWAEGATLVVVRPSADTMERNESGFGAQLGRGGGADVAEELREDAELATAAFGGGLYGEAVQSLLKGRSYILEMNSF